MNIEEVKQNPQNYEVNFSDKALAKLSGTQALHGNWPPRVWETMRTCGLLPEKDWPSDFSSYENYYAEIPAELQLKAKEFLKYFRIKYQWVINGKQEDDNVVKEAIGVYLKQSPLQTCSPVCPTWFSEIASPCGKRNADHATMIYKIVKGVAIYIFDHYPSFRKLLTYLYPTDFVMQGIIEPITPEVKPVPHYVLNTNLCYGMRKNEDVKHLQEELIYLGLLSEGLTTGNYLEQTRIAVKKFLVKYNVTSPFRIAINNGRWVYELTRKKLNEIFK